MERVGVSYSLLRTYDQHVGFTSDFVSGDDEKYLILVACSFFCVLYLSGKQILSKCLYLHGCISGSRCVYFHSGVRFLLADLSCLQLGHLSATQLKQVIMLSMCESPLPTADTQRYLFWLRAQGLWNIIFHLRPAAVNGACVNTQGSVSKSFCALEFPSTMVYKEMFRTALMKCKWRSYSVAWSASEDHVA